MQDEIGRSDPREGSPSRRLPEEECVDSPRAGVPFEARTKGPFPYDDKPRSRGESVGNEIDDPVDGLRCHEAADAHGQRDPSTKCPLLERRFAHVRDLDGAGFDACDALESMSKRGIEGRREALDQGSRHEAPSLGAPKEAEDYGASNRLRQCHEQTDVRPVRDELERPVEAAADGPPARNRPMRHDAVKRRE
jgi:hypothetical protein